MSDHRANVTDNDRQRRVQLGKWIKSLRTDKDLTQVEASRLLGYRYNTTLSQFESAKSPLPPRLWADMAKVYGVPPKVFAMRALKLSEPEVFDMLFGADADGGK